MKILLNENFILKIIILNSILIFIQGFPSMSNIFILNLIDNIFTLFFITELFVKLKFNKEYFKNNWNIFDFILIISSIPSFFIFLIYQSSSGFEFLLVFRILRTLKFLRFIRFIPNISDIIKGVSRALKSSLIILLAFFIFNFIISVLSCFLFRDIAPEMFGNPLISFYSIFKIFTIEGWNEIPDTISKYDITPSIIFFSNLFFMLILLLGGIFGLSIVNSIFVDAMVSDNNDELEKKVDNLNKKIDILINETK